MVTGQENYALLDYFAVIPELRGNGIGSEFLQNLKEFVPVEKGTFIEAESPDSAKDSDEMQIRRKRIDFYISNGAVMTNSKCQLFGVDYNILYISREDGVEFSGDRMNMAVEGMYDAAVNGSILYTYYTDADCTILTGSEGETASGAAGKGAAPVNAGTYYVVASVAEQDNYTAAKSAAATLTITKAVYDMSGVSFEDTTYSYDGTEKSLVISGTLPDGVTVSYENNTLTSAGSTTATAIFTGDTDNYEAIASMTATLTVVILTEVPKALQDNPDLNTVEKIEAYLKALVTIAEGYTTENSIVYDVTFMISFDGGLTWEIATAENFPANGLTVLLPYPEGTETETESSVQTGDETPLGIWFTLFLMSAAVLLMMGERKRQRR